MKLIFKNCAVTLFGTLLGLLSVSPAHAQVTIGVDPFSPTDYAVGINYSGGSNPALDETFAVPADNLVLNSISLYTTTVTDAEAGLDASVYQWSPTTDTPVGGAVWSSTAPQTIPASNFSTPELVTFNTGGVELNPDDDYILEFIAYDSGPVTGTPAIFDVPDGTYASGDFVAFGNDTYYPQPGTNLVFTATFAPEPSTWAMLLGGLGLLAFWRHRMRRT